MQCEKLIEQWPVDNATAIVIDSAGGIRAQYGDTEREYRLASVTKPLSAYAALIAIEEGVVDLDTPAGPEGATVKHLLAHTSGLGFDGPQILAQPGTRRLYSNTGFIQLADAIAEHSGIAFADYAAEALFAPLKMRNTRLTGSAASGAYSTSADLARFAAELQKPSLLHAETLASATAVVFPGLSGVLPGFGYQKENDWGLGFEIRDHKTPHWTGANNSPATYGHFGQSGTFLWVDPEAHISCVALTDRDFGEWAAEVWPPFNDAVLAEFGHRLTS